MPGLLYPTRLCVGQLLCAHALRCWGEDYSIFDMAVWGWARAVPFILGAEAWDSLPNLKRLLDSIDERPAAPRAEALKEKFQFKSDMDESARKAMFPQNERLA